MYYPLICLILSFLNGLFMITLCASKSKTSEKKVTAEPMSPKVEPIPSPSTKPDENISNSKDVCPSKTSPLKAKDPSVKKQASKKEETPEDPVRRWRAQTVADQNWEELTEDYSSYVHMYDQPRTFEAFEANLQLNRRKDQKVYDHTRVFIHNKPRNYINASLVKHHYPNQYILTQGPLSETTNDFWNMCSQKNIKHIIQLCDFVEDGIEQSARYFGPEKEDIKKYGDIEVKTTEKKEHPVEGTTWTILNIRDIKAKSDTQTINHYLINWWKDKEIPLDPKRVVLLQQWMTKNRTEGVPTVIMCNNGTFRSGMFAAIGYCDEFLQDPSGEYTYDIPSALSCFHKKRNHVIGSLEEYLFVHACLVELYKNEKLITNELASQFFAKYNNHVQKKNGTSEKMKEDLSLKTTQEEKSKKK